MIFEKIAGPQDQQIDARDGLELFFDQVQTGDRTSTTGQLRPKTAEQYDPFDPGRLDRRGDGLSAGAVMADGIGRLEIWRDQGVDRIGPAKRTGEKLRIRH